MGANTSSVLDEVFVKCGFEHVSSPFGAQGDEGLDASDCGLEVMGRDVSLDEKRRRRRGGAAAASSRDALWGEPPMPSKADSGVAASASEEDAVTSASWLTPRLVCLSRGECDLGGEVVDASDEETEADQKARRPGGGGATATSAAEAAAARARQRPLVAVEPEVYAGGDGAAVASRPSRRALDEARAREQLETSLKELFGLHDLNQDGVLDEQELIKLNEKIAKLHHGKHADMGAVRAKFRELFRSHLDPEGRPVPFATFRAYMLQVLLDNDPDPRAQELMMEQFIAEARSGLAAFRCHSFESVSDAPFRHTVLGGGGGLAMGGGGGGGGEEEGRPADAAVAADAADAHYSSGGVRRPPLQ